MEIGEVAAAVRVMAVVNKIGTTTAGLQVRQAEAVVVAVQGTGAANRTGMTRDGLHQATAEAGVVSAQGEEAVVPEIQAAVIQATVVPLPTVRVLPQTVPVQAGREAIRPQVGPGVLLMAGDHLQEVVDLPIIVQVAADRVTGAIAEAATMEDQAEEVQDPAIQDGPVRQGLRVALGNN